MLNNYITSYCCCNSLLYLTLLLLSISGFLYSCFGIFFLVIEREMIRNECHLWWYIFSSLLISSIFGCFPKNYFFSGLWTISTILLLIFGGLEIWNSTCESSCSPNFRDFGRITFILQSISLFLMSFFCLFPARKKQETFEVCNNV